MQLMSVTDILMSIHYILSPMSSSEVKQRPPPARPPPSFPPGPTPLTATLSLSLLSRHSTPPLGLLWAQPSLPHEKAAKVGWSPLKLIKLEETELNGRSNQSVVSEFIFLGLCDSWELQAFLLVIFSSLYLITILGNIFIVLLITADLHLHCPMYFLLANLSFIDLCLSSVTTPKMITDFLKANKSISFGSCMCQIFFGHFFGGCEMVLLVSMAYDRYMAICKPLHYSSIMNTQMCIRLVMTSWTIGFVHSISQLAIIIQLPFCGPRELDSFFCDIPLVIKLACMDTYILEMLINADSGVLATICFILLLISYSYILLTLCHQSKDGASKALSTCTAHITVVVLFFGPCIFIYLFPLNITWVDKFLAVFYAAITPLLNPVIYTLRNKEIRNAIKRL
ncbi:olfactory receptor 4F4-like [Cervus elaphus]|uniref:olfactory receptor 4F4-like n=1 Tax=Cervus elaphus TaxID=9860 RepID=UPI001CC2B1CC|nr:olfactory receptor 4F4-like [Cervus elaphus]